MFMPLQPSVLFNLAWDKITELNFRFTGGLSKQPLAPIEHKDVEICNLLDLIYCGFCSREKYFFLFPKTLRRKDRQYVERDGKILLRKKGHTVRVLLPQTNYAHYFCLGKP